MFFEETSYYHPQFETFMGKSLELVEKSIVDSDFKDAGTGNFELNDLEDVQVAATMVSDQCNHFSRDCPDKFFVIPHVTIISLTFGMDVLPGDVQDRFYFQTLQVRMTRIDDPE
jgi:hypothetical protein